MLYIGYRRVDIEKDNVHGYSFYYSEPIEPKDGEGFSTGKDYVSDNFPDLQSRLKVAVSAKEVVRVERNKYGKVIGIIE